MMIKDILQKYLEGQHESKAYLNFRPVCRMTTEESRAESGKCKNKNN